MHRLLGLAVAAIVAAPLAGCAQPDPIPEMPPPAMALLFDANRMVWLSRHDDDQLTIAEVFWEAVHAADASVGEDLDSQAIWTLQRTGRGASLLFAEEVDVGVATGVTSILVVLDPGDTKELSEGDILGRAGEEDYRVLGRAEGEPLEAARTALAERMGLE